MADKELAAPAAPSVPMFYTVILVAGPDNDNYPLICYDGREPICTSRKEHAKDHLRMAQEQHPNHTFKLGTINV